MATSLRRSSRVSGRTARHRADRDAPPAHRARPKHRSGGRSFLIAIRRRAGPGQPRQLRRGDARSHRSGAVPLPQLGPDRTSVTDLEGRKNGVPVGLPGGPESQDPRGAGAPRTTASASSCRIKVGGDTSHGSSRIDRWLGVLDRVGPLPPMPIGLPRPGEGRRRRKPRMWRPYLLVCRVPVRSRAMDAAPPSPAATLSTRSQRQCRAQPPSLPRGRKRRHFFRVRPARSAAAEMRHGP